MFLGSSVALSDRITSISADYACQLQSGDITSGIPGYCIASLAQLMIRQEYVPIDMTIMKFEFKPAHPTLQCHERGVLLYKPTDH
jgi:hypothetical protein